jgi:hypothetical protein
MLPAMILASQRHRTSLLPKVSPRRRLTPRALITRPLRDTAPLAVRGCGPQSRITLNSRTDHGDKLRDQASHHELRPLTLAQPPHRREDAEPSPNT